VVKKQQVAIDGVSILIVFKQKEKNFKPNTARPNIKISMNEIDTTPDSFLRSGIF